MSLRNKHVHFIGIAGKGMSATALLLRELGCRISG
jgi:UDP-N-acetylmuramate-alanine ligase